MRRDLALRFAILALGLLLASPAAAADADDARPPGDEALSAACDDGDPGACQDLAIRLLAAAGPARDAARAVRLLERACDAGALPACLALGQLLERGDGARRDLGAAERRYRKVCDAGAGAGCGLLARIFARRGGPPDALRQAAAAAQRTCEAGDRTSCATVAAMALEGVAFQRDEARARAVLDAACRQGEAFACLRLALARPDWTAEVLRLLELACAGGEGRGCTEAALRHGRARGVPADSARARSLYEAGCALGDGAGCAYVADAAERRGDHALAAAQATRARELLQAGCDADLAHDCLELGTTLSAGLPGAPRAAADEWLRRACDLSSVEGCFRAALFWERGEGDRAPDASKAKTLFGRAATLAEAYCEKGDADACRLLGEAYGAGRGVAPDAKKAEAYRSRACELGSRTACDDDPEAWFLW